MHIVALCLSLIVIVLLFVIIVFVPTKTPPPDIEKVLHLLSTDELSLSHMWATNIQSDIGSIRHFIFHGSTIACGYGFHWGRTELGADIIFFESVEIIFLNDQKGLRIEFEGGQSKQWGAVPHGDICCWMDEHQRWIFQKILFTVKNVLDAQTQGALS